MPDHVDVLTMLPRFCVEMWRNLWGWVSWKCWLTVAFCHLFCFHTCVSHGFSSYFVVHFDVFFLPDFLFWPRLWEFLSLFSSFGSIGERSVTELKCFTLASCCEWNGVRLHDLGQLAWQQAKRFCAGSRHCSACSCQCQARRWGRRGSMRAVGCQGASCLDE